MNVDWCLHLLGMMTARIAILLLMVNKAHALSVQSEASSEIHQTAEGCVPKNIIVTSFGLPKDINLWEKYAWRKSYGATKEYFKGFNFVEAEEEDIRNCYEQYFPKKAKELYESKVTPTMLSDAGRACLLYQHGGIYMDLDYSPTTNFYDQIPCENKVSLVQGTSNPNVSQKVLNLLMASPAKHPFWESLIEKFSFKDPHSTEGLLDGTGPLVYERVLNMKQEDMKDRSGTPPRVNLVQRSDVVLLPCDIFNPGQDVLGGKRAPGCGTERFPRNKAEANSLGVEGIHWGTQAWNENRDNMAANAELFFGADSPSFMLKQAKAYFESD